MLTPVAGRALHAGRGRDRLRAQAGRLVVRAGVHKLHAGQKVRVLAENGE